MTKREGRAILGGMLDPDGASARAQSPYRDTRPAACEPRRDGLTAPDIVVVTAIALCIAGIGRWHQAVESFATHVLGFPPLP